MGALFVVFFIGLIGVVLIGSILGLTSSGRLAKLEQQNRNLNTRVKALELAQAQGELTSVSPATPEIAAPPVEASPPEVPLKPAPAAPIPAKPTPQPVAVATISPAKRAPKTASFSKPEPKKPKRNLEELIGGQWSVWVGGLALLVGAVLLIRFSIEAGFFGPAARIVMAIVLGAALLLAGEWLKRSDDKVLSGRLGEAAKALRGNASVPGLLSAVGIFTLLGASYAAHELYNLIPAIVAFLALAVISLGAMALSLRQGPLLAAIGLLASLATPLLIQTDTPSLLMLIIYLVIIGGAALALSRRTGWGWLATGTVFGWLGWSLMSVEAATNGQLLLWSAFLALGFVVSVWFAQQDDTSDREGLAVLNLHPIFAVIWAGLAALLVLIVVGQSTFQPSGPALPEFLLGALSVAALMSTSVFVSKQSGHLVTGGLLALILLLMVVSDWQTAVLMAFTVGGVVLSLRQSDRSHGKMPINHAWEVFAVGLGLASVVALDTAETAASADRFHAAIALGFAGLFAAASGLFRKRGHDWKSLTILVIGAGAGWTLAAILAFDGLAFSLFMSLGAAYRGNRCLARETARRALGSIWVGRFGLRPRACSSNSR